uniref:Uncharacterized protein n=1 Tax=Meloidogyne enterolobii TaxID=390850 RepID=A0A6V7THA1_MELEN|nr:unnamed protein product [Meloidogyne enterolobii]
MSETEIFPRLKTQDPRQNFFQDQDSRPRPKLQDSRPKIIQDSRQVLGPIGQIFGLFFIILTQSQSTSAQSPIISKNLCEIQRILGNLSGWKINEIYYLRGFGSILNFIHRLLYTH